MNSPLIQPKLKVGLIVKVKNRGRQPFMVVSVTEHTVRVKQWPIIDAPPAEEVLRTEIVGQEEGDE
jgi:hypothetical protein